MRSILFVCTANICRSPMAEGVFRKLVADSRREADFEIDSAGTHDYHIGKAPYEKALECARKRGYEISHLVARRVVPNDFDHFDAILGMDRGNVASLKTIVPTRCKHKIEMLLDYSERFHGRDVPDPIGGDARRFDLALDMIEDGCRGLAQLLLRAA